MNYPNENIKMIAAVSLNGVIGQNNNLPWGHDYPEDLAFFRKMTSNSTVIMGRKTFESIGRPLPKRRNIVISSNAIDNENIEIFKSMKEALDTCDGQNVWLIGGSRVYQEGLKYASEIYVTNIPKIIDGDDLVYFPYVHPRLFLMSGSIPIDDVVKENRLFYTKYERYLNPEIND